jgi:ubiquinone/menaquinone biosynthesis C-methylase UbiE
MSDVLKETSRSFRTLRHMQALTSTIRSAQNIGLFQALRESQKTIDELADKLKLNRVAMENICRLLLAFGIIEQYGEDLALSNAAALQLESDPTFNSYLFNDIEKYVSQEQPTYDLTEFRRRLAGRQWNYSAAARQAAQVISSGNTRKPTKMLELGCLTGVWSAAIAFMDENLEITSVDSQEFLARSRGTYQSVELEQRRTEIETNYRAFTAELESFDVVLFAEGLQLEDDASAVVILGRCADSLRVGGEIIIIEPLMETGEGQDVAVAAHALEIAMSTPGCTRSAIQIQQLLTGAGFETARWATLTADDQGLGIVIAKRSDHLG